MKRVVPATDGLRQELAWQQAETQTLFEKLASQSSESESLRISLDTRQADVIRLEQEVATMRDQVAKLGILLDAAAINQDRLVRERQAQANDLQSIRAELDRLSTASARLPNGRLARIERRVRQGARLAWSMATHRRWRLLARLRANASSRAIVAAGLLDSEWYHARYPDLRELSMHPALHYVKYGAFEGRDPNAMFDTKWYLGQNPSVNVLLINPLMHYLRHGAAAGLNPGPFFDTQGYLTQNADVAATGMNPLAHYLRHGFNEGRLSHSTRRVLPGAKIAVVAHVFYEAIWEEVASYLQHIPIAFDLYVSVPQENGATLRALVLGRCPQARIIEVRNVGRDLGAFFAVLCEIPKDRYAAICKIHTKHGRTDPETWRYLLLRGTLGSKLLITRIVHAFQTDPDLFLVGPCDVYLSSVNFMLDNAPLVHEIAERLYPGRKLPAEWGFFAGTMFWLRPSMVTKLADILRDIPFELDNSQADGQVAHALERLFGLIAAMEGKRIGLTDVFGSRSLDMALDVLRAPGCPRRELASVLQARAEERRRNPFVAPRPALRRWIAPRGRLPGVNLIGPIEYPNGLGVSARGFMASLSHAGVALNVIPWRIGFQRLHPTPMHHPKAELQPINLVHLNLDLLTGLRALDCPPLSNLTGVDCYNVAIVYWELASIPLEWIDVIHRFDEIWCASTFMARAIAGVTRRPVRVVRPAVEGMTSADTGTRRNFRLPDDRFVFFYAVDSFSVLGRKNPQALLAAYVAEFTPDEGAFCLLKIHSADAHSPAMKEILSIVEQRPDIVLLDKMLDSVEMKTLYALIDCYVSPHRSEGLGLTILEAMNAKKPVIATGYGGMTDFVNSETAYIVDHQLVEVGEGNSPYPENFVWADPLQDSLQVAMRSVFEDRHVASSIGQKGYAQATEMFSLDKTARDIAAEIERIWCDGSPPEESQRTTFESVTGPAGVDVGAEFTTKRALAKSVQEQTPGGKPAKGLVTESYRVQWPVDEAVPVTLLMLTGSFRRKVEGRGDILLVENAVNSIIERSRYPNYKILVLDDGKMPAHKQEHFTKAGVLVKQYRREDDFNYARKLNHGFSLVDTEDVIVLNDDIEVITPDWIEALLGFSQQPRVGAVGGMLVYPDHRIQHAGIALGVELPATHIFHGLPDARVERNGYSHVARNCSAVTGAVLATRMSLVRELAGFDENMAIDYNDVDFCLRLEKLGYSVVYTPYAKLYHFENSSIMRQCANKADESYFLSRWRDRIALDPCHIPGFNLFESTIS